MKRLGLHITLLLLSCQLLGQDAKTHKFSLQAGSGVFQYINTLKIGANLVNPTQLSFSFRVMREFEHRLAIGLETGHYRIYSIVKTPSAGNPLSGQANLSIVPIFLNIRMRVISNFYLTGGTGVSILSSEFGGLVGPTESSQISLADFQISVLYLKSLSDRWRLGGELRFIEVAKTEDYGFALHLVATYQF